MDSIILWTLLIASKLIANNQAQKEPSQGKEPAQSNHQIHLINLFKPHLNKLDIIYTQ